ncbi:MAG TPA: hypothetical protein VHR45_22860 [Thermoanaerobaculia bacterium]|nr:hypothetical protein [Thermoanaerobaculia bacterium]
MLSLEHQASHEWLRELSAEGRQALLHILGCPECRQAAEESLLRPHLPPPPGGEQSYDLPFARQQRNLLRLLDLVTAEERRGRELLEELILVPGGERRKAIRRQPEFWRPELARELLRKAEAELLSDPDESEELAALATAVAARLPAADPLGQAQAARVLAGCLAGEARRRRGDPGAALAAYEEIASQLDGALDHDLRATWCAGLAKVRWEERRDDEAAALLGRAANIYAANGQTHAEGLCRALTGFLCLELCDPTAAFVPLDSAHRLLEPAVAPALAARTALALAYCHAATGCDESWRNQAAALLAEARQLGSAVTMNGERTGWKWWEARVAARLGDRDRALAKLETVRQCLLARGSVREAALATLDLAVLRASCGRREGLAELGHDLYHAFPESAPLRHAGSFAVLERLSLDDFPAGVEMLRRDLLGSRRAGRGRRDLITHVRDLAVLPAA